ncbi:hypothetical protein DXG01_015720 [Tephrocybe rancida]|nr:hypothetical protein DXG01_015720 [Tephrocybe rancida]
MLFYFTARIVSSASAFLYPGYASYKTLSQRPASEEELERWLMYWSVLGCLVGVEYLAEWLVSWIPLYYTSKTIFLLYLALPQTQGASYMYRAHLQPFFHAHETQIDAALASLKAKAYKFIQERLRALWDSAAASLQQTPSGSGQSSPGASAPQPPTLADPVSGPSQLAGSLWRTYGPGIMASGAVLLRSATASASTPPSSSNNLRTPPTTHPESQSVLERRRQLEAELAALASTIPPTRATASTSTSSRPSSSASNLGLRERTNSGSGRFEEIEVPSDVEGYDVGDHEGQGEARPAAASRGSWFGWASGSAQEKGYERVKSE